MKITIIRPDSEAFPTTLRNIHTVPEQLYVLGNIELLQAPQTLAVVGSRAVTTYGKHITEMLVSAAAQKGVVTVSGLALGVDGIAHKATLDAGGQTIAVLANGLDTIHPATHRDLAKRILQQGGAIISEYPEGTKVFRGNFVARNRIVSGLSKAVLITEATEKSGTLHTARFALEQGKDVLAVPGNITSTASVGTNNLLKAGATPVTGPEDIWNYFGFGRSAAQQTLLGSTQEEQVILDLLQQGITDSAELLAGSNLTAPAFNQALTMLEISGIIKPLGAGHWAVR